MLPLLEPATYGLEVKFRAVHAVAQGVVLDGRVDRAVQQLVGSLLA
jgi:hypothetical protein